MTTAVSERMDQIRDIVVEHLEISPDELTEDSSFADDHDADSLTLMDVLAALEMRFGITIDQQQFARMVDLRGLYEVVAESAGW